MLLKDRVCLITGAGATIGRAVALRFAEEGAVIAAAGIGRAAIEETARMVRDRGGHATAVAGDTSDEAQVRAVVDAAARATGRIDVLVAAHPAPPAPRDLVNTPTVDWDRWIHTTLRSTMLCCKHAVASMQRGGSIITLASLNGRRGAPGQSADSAGQWGIIGLTQSLAWEAGRLGIRVNCIVPGAVSEDETGLFGGEAMDRITAVRPPRAVLDPGEIADAALYLASARAEAMTGQTINVNAGAWYS